MTQTRDKATELAAQGYCILHGHFARPLIEACRDAFAPELSAYLANRRRLTTLLRAVAAPLSSVLSMG
jgi:hypothetical protein